MNKTVLQDPDPGADRAAQAEWMRAIAEAQDEDAFARLFAFFAPRLKSYLMREGAADEAAEEIAQEVMTTVWRKARSYKPEAGAVSTWIFRIARNRRIDQLRRGNRPELDPDDPFFHPPAEMAPDRALEGGQRDAIIRRALGELPQDQQETMRLAFYEGLSQSEIAETRRIPLGTVKSRFRLAFEKLRAALDEAGL